MTKSGVITGTTYTYDQNGNQLLTIRTKYTDGVPEDPVILQDNTYDAFNQLIKTVTQDGTVVENAYNGEGRRVEKRVNGTTTYYLCEYDKVIMEKNVWGDVTGRNIYGTNLLIRIVGADTYFFMWEPARIIDNLLRWKGAENAQKSEAGNGSNQETVRRGLQEKGGEIIACESEAGPRNCRGPGDSRKHIV